MGKPFVLIDLDRPRQLRFSTNALVLLEELLGKATPEIAAGLQTGSWGFRELRAMLYAGLVGEDRQLTVNAVGELMDLKPLDYLVSKIGEAFDVAFPNEDTEKNVEAVTPGTGASSSESPPPAE